MAAKKTGLASMLANYKTPSSFGSPALKKKPVTPAWDPMSNSQALSASGAAPSTWTPPAPAAATSAVLPVDPTYDATLGQLGKTRDDTIAGLEGQRTSGLLGYGYTADYNADGTVKGLQYDPNNPYSQAALARTVYQQSKTGTDNSAAARGQLNAGSRINAQNQNDTVYNVGEDTRIKGLTSFLNQIGAGEKSAKDAYALGQITADGDRVTRAPTLPGYTPSAPAAPAQTAPTAADLIKQWQSGSGVKSTYTNAQGHPVRVLQNGSKEVYVNGKWSRV